MEKASIKNYFELFGLKPKFDINVDDLTDRYLRLQSSSHPDCYHDVGSKRDIQSNAILINEAYQTLKSPLRRAEYLLSFMLKAYDVMKPTQDLLMEIMEMREQVKGEDPFLNEAYNTCIEDIKAAFDNNDTYDMAYNAMKLKYITKIKEDICN